MLQTMSLLPRLSRGLSRCCFKPSQIQRYSTSSHPAPLEDEARPFSEMPGPSTFETTMLAVKTLAGAEEIKYAHWYTYDAFKKYGSVFHVKFPALNMIWLNDVPAIERLLRLDGKYPARIMVQSWKEWRELNDKELGVLTV